MIVKTQTGSLYEIDEDNKQVRRLHGTKQATKLQGDNEWKKYAFIADAEVGQSLLIIWADKAEGYAVPTTITSPITEINPVQS
jgi:hypothetical protein